MADLIGKLDSLNKGRVKLNEAITDADIAKVTSKGAEVTAGQARVIAQTAKDKSDNTQTQLDAIVINGDSSVEAAQARVDTKGFPYATLKHRLDAEMSTVTSRLGDNTNLIYQTDLIELINRMTTYDKLFYMRESGHEDLTMVMVKGNEHITWNMKKSNVDDFWILGECFAGKVIWDSTLYEKKDYGTLSGNWNTTDSTLRHYAQNVGDTFTTTVTGERIDFYHYSDNNGGLWEFTVDGDTSNKVIVSTWSETPNTSVNMQPVTLFNNLNEGVHTIVGKFLGDDPAHPPVNGVNKSKGWVWFNGTNGLKTFHTYVNSDNQFTNQRDKELLVDFSNKELALKMYPLANPAVTPAYTPAHTGVGTTYDREIKAIYVDGKNIIGNNLRDSLIALPSWKKYECNEISFVQKMRAQIPGYANDLVHYDVIHTFDKKGNVNITGKLTVLEDIHVNELFTFMLPVAKSSIDRLLTSKNNYYPATKTDGSETNLVPTEGDTTSSFAFTSSADPNYIMAGRINNLNETLRRGATDKGNKYTWLQHRDSSMTKLYTEAMRSGQLQAGKVIKFSQTYNCAKINDIHNVI